MTKSRRPRTNYSTADRIKFARESIKLSPEAAAKKYDVSVSTIGNWRAALRQTSHAMEAPKKAPLRLPSIQELQRVERAKVVRIIEKRPDVDVIARAVAQAIRVVIAELKA